MLQQVLSCLAAVTLLVVHAVGAIAALPGSHSLSLYSDGASTLLSLQPPRPRPPRRVGNEHDEKAWKSFKKQIDLLKKLKCKPKNIKIPVRPFISGYNDILDMDPHPEVVVVKRCEDACSYCGNPLGFENQVCKPEIEKNKTFFIFYQSRRGQGIHKVRIPVHKKCMCR